MVELLEHEPRFVRPLNYPPGTAGRGSAFFECSGKPPVAVINVQGRTFMPNLDNPFSAMPAEVDRCRERTPIILVDVHAEATSEKIAMARMLDGTVSAVVGTHTHVRPRMSRSSRAALRFCAMPGLPVLHPHESVLGREIEPIIRRFCSNTPQRFGVARDRVLLQGVVIGVDDATGRAVSIERISEPMPSPAA